MPRAVLALASILVVTAAVATTIGVSPDPLLVDNAQQLGATVGALIALGISWRGRARDNRRVHLAVVASALVALTGQAAWYLGPNGSTTPSPVADLLLITAAGILLAGVAPGLFAGLPRSIRVGATLDAAIIFLAGSAIMAAFWQRQQGGLPAVDHLPAILAAMALVSASGAGFVGLLARRVQPGLYGPWAVIDGLAAVGIGWIAWYGSAQHGSVVGVLPTDYLLSAGLLLVAHGVTTWDSQRVTTPGFLRFARNAGDALPVFAIVICIVLDILAPEADGIDAVEWLAGAVVCLAGARQLLLLGRERRAKDAEVEAAHRLERMTRTRAETILTLSRLEPGATPEETAQRICREALRLDGIDTAVVRAFTSDGVVPIATSGLDDCADVLVGGLLPPDRAAQTLARAREDSWLEIIDADLPGDHLSLLYASGLRGTANAVLRWNDHVIGAIGLGTRAEGARTIVTEHAATAHEFAIVAAALLGPQLVARERTTSVRRAIAGIIETGAFHPVYQPIVDLATSQVVGYEALTRFDDGCRPDLRFAEAAGVGMGTALEAHLHSRRRRGRRSPAGRPVPQCERLTKACRRGRPAWAGP